MSGCAECTSVSRAWYVDVDTGAWFCSHHGRNRDGCKPYPVAFKDRGGRK